MQSRLIKCFSLLLYSALILGGIWLSVRFLLPWLAPFLLAFALAALLEPAVSAMVRGGWRRSIAAGVLTLLLLALLVWGVLALSAKGVSAATDFARRAPELMAALGQALESAERKTLAYIAAAPDGVAEYMKTALEAVGSALYALPAALSQWLLDALRRAAQASPDFLLFSVTAGIGTYFISASFPRTKAFIKAQLPEKLCRRASILAAELKNGFGGFLRAQLILMAMTFFELLLAFLLLRVENAVGIAAVTAVIDALPVFGTGIVLVPWAAYALLTGETGLGVGLIICWGIVNLVRSCVQAKLLGDQIGLDPLVSLAAVYVGWRVWNVWGMLFFPLLFAAVQQLNDKGLIKLWKNV